MYLMNGIQQTVSLFYPFSSKFLGKFYIIKVNNKFVRDLAYVKNIMQFKNSGKAKKYYIGLKRK